MGVFFLFLFFVLVLDFVMFLSIFLANATAPFSTDAKI